MTMCKKIGYRDRIAALLAITRTDNAHRDKPGRMYLSDGGWREVDTPPNSANDQLNLGGAR